MTRLFLTQCPFFAVPSSCCAQQISSTVTMYPLTFPSVLPFLYIFPSFFFSACIQLITTNIIPFPSHSLLLISAFLQCSVTFVVTPPQSQFALWYKKEKKKNPAMNRLFSLFVTRGWVRAVWEMWLYFISGNILKFPIHSYNIYRCIHYLLLE